MALTNTKALKPKSVLMKFYEIFPGLTAICNKAGYSLAQHGSLARDIDLVAIPWTERAISAQALVNRICKANITKDNWPEWRVKFGKDRILPTIKPHGRLAWPIHIDESTYIDLSVMPRTIRPTNP